MSFARQVIELAREQGRTIAVAESCTGGRIGGALTAVSGSSSVFLGGVIAYSNEVKHALLGVPNDIFVSHGAVSEACARAMAEGARAATGADIAVSVTGIAGPGGGSKAKPVGTVYIGYAGFGGTRAERHHFDGDREAVRARTVEEALGELLRILQVEARNIG